MNTMDILTRHYATGADADTMDAGCHYDYRAQEWIDGHDHAHFTDDTSPLMFCGADIVSCTGRQS